MYFNFLHRGMHYGSSWFINSLRQSFRITNLKDSQRAVINVPFGFMLSVRDASRCIRMHHDAHASIHVTIQLYNISRTKIKSCCTLWFFCSATCSPAICRHDLYLYHQKNWRQETRILKRKAPSRAPITTHRKQGWPFPNPIKGRGRTPAVLLRLAWQTMGTWQHLPICGRTTRMTLRRFVVSSL